MANNPNEPSSDDFFDQILSFQTFTNSDGTLPGSNGAALSGAMNAPSHAHMMLQLSSGDDGFHGGAGFPLGLSLEHGRPHGHGGLLKAGDESMSAMRFREDVVDNYRPPQVFRGQPMANPVPTAPQPTPMRPRVRARRGQATDPHSIAERLRRERIAERIRALQELVPSVNKTDRAAMLDEIVDYVKFLRLQVKVLSMSRLGGAGAVAPLVTDIPLSAVEKEGIDGENRPAWEKWSNEGTERQVAKLMKEDMGGAMQLLQSKSLCVMPISLATAIYHAQPPENSTIVKPETSPP